MSSEHLSFDQFREVHLIAATIRTAERVEGTDKLLRLEVDCGDHERQLVAGIGASYDPADLPGKRIVVVANLAPARIRGVESQGMLLAAQDDEGRLSLAVLERDVASGSRVS